MNYINHLFAMFYALKRRLELMPPSCPSTEKTRILTEEIQRFCDHECVGFMCEVPIEPLEYRSSGKLRRGIVDVFIRTTDGKVFAIEIDRGNKTWSLDKLGHCRIRYNAVPIWIRWSGTVDCEIPADIVVADLTGRSLLIRNDHVLEITSSSVTIPSPSTGRSYSVADIRKTYPNAYKPWDDADDRKLLAFHEKGMGCVELASLFGRKIGAISSRLGHLKDEDM